MATISYGGVKTTFSEYWVEVNKDTMPSNGWITNITQFLARDSGGTSADMKIILYKGDNRVVQSGTLSTSSTTLVEKNVDCNVRTGEGSIIRWGHVGQGVGSTTYETKVDFDSSNSNIRQHYSWGAFGSESIWPSSIGDNPGITIGGTLTYQPNIAPNAPTWPVGFPNGTVVNQTPTITGNMSQGADAAYDTIDRYSVEVYHDGTGALVYGGTGVWVNTTSAERTAGQWTETITGLSANETYRIRARTEDSWGVKSGYSVDRTFTTAAGPNAPTPITPVGKQTTPTPSYTATHTHPSGLSTNAVQVIVRSAGGTILRDSGTITDSTAAGGTITATSAEVGLTLTWATDYTWEMRARDTVGSWGSWTATNAFSTNRPPNTPTNLSPQEGQVLHTSVFTANISDPEGDDINDAQIDIVRVSNGVAHVTGAAMTVDNATGTLSYTATGLVDSNQYRYRIRARDVTTATGYGPWTDYVTYLHAVVPTVQLIGPMASRTNLIAQPSAEYDPVDLSAYWTVTVGGTGQALVRVQEDNAPYGAYAWEATGNASGNIDQTTTDYITVDATKAHSFFTWARTTSGTPLFSFQVLCYTSANALISTIRPSSLRDSNAITPPTTWTRYGGIVSQIGGTATAFPATTAKIKIRVLHTSSTGVLQFDAFSMAQMPYNPDTGTDPNQRLRAQEWLGYADGDFEGFGVGGYSWSGTPGDSSSSILPILDAATGASVVINYSHTNTKTGDRLIIEKWTNGDWDEVADTNPTETTTSGGNREIIPLPTGVIENEGRYRLQALVSDNVVPQWGQSEAVEFDVYYVGPAQLDIVIAEAIPEKAQNRLVWNPSVLDPGVFAGVEVQRIDLGGEEDTQVIHVEIDQGVTEFIDHYPAAGREYQYRIRQLEIVATDQIGGFWASANLTCDYVYNFLKDVANPDLFTAYDTEAQNLVGYSEDAPVGMLAPWGAARPTVLQRWKLRTRTGEVVAGFFPDAGIEYADFPDADTRFDRARRIMKRRQTIAILLPYPEPTKVFAAIIGEARTTFPYPPTVRGVEFSWQEVSWSEDYYERMGLT